MSFKVQFSITWFLIRPRVILAFIGCVAHTMHAFVISKGESRSTSMIAPVSVSLTTHPDLLTMRSISHFNSFVSCILKGFLAGGFTQ